MITLETLGEVRLRPHALATAATALAADTITPTAVAVDSANTATAFAAFASQRGGTLSVPDLVEAVWRGQPTRTARQGVHVQISRMRKMLGGLGCDGAEAIVKVASGYRLNTDLITTDLDDFERRAKRGHTAHRSGAAAEALRLFDEALDLWRGEPMSGLALGPSLSRHRESLERLHLEVREARAEVLIQLGAGREVIAEIQSLIDADPYQELLHAGLMIALSRSGRRGEALRVYRNLACRLNTDLGIRPDPRVHGVFQAIADGTEYCTHHIYDPASRDLRGAS